MTSRGRDDRRFARAFAEHLLERKTTRVRLLTPRKLVGLRAEGKVFAATVVVTLSVRHERRTHAQWGQDPDIVCDALGCFAVGGERDTDVQALRSSLHVRVSDGPTDRELQRVVLRAVERGRTFRSMRKLAVTTLVQKLQAASEQRVLAQEIVLSARAPEGMDEVLDLVEEGHWQRARTAAEALAASPRAAALGARARAAFLHDLAQIRRFSRREPTLADLDAARMALTEAMRLAPSERLRRALALLARQREATLRVFEQRAAARHNFSLARSGAGDAATGADAGEGDAGAGAPSADAGPSPDGGEAGARRGDAGGAAAAPADGGARRAADAGAADAGASR